MRWHIVAWRRLCKTNIVVVVYEVEVEIVAVEITVLLYEVIVAITLV